MAMLCSVSEALSVLDTEFVRNDGQTTAGAVRRAVQVLVDHVQVQAAQLSRIEDILAAFGSPSQQGGTVWSKLAAKADLSRLERLEQQVDAVGSDALSLKAKQHEAAARHDDLSGRLEQLREQVAALELRVGYNPALTAAAGVASALSHYGTSPAGGASAAYQRLTLAAAGGVTVSGSRPGSAGLMMGPGTTGAAGAMGGSSVLLGSPRGAAAALLAQGSQPPLVPASGSLLDRLQRVERRVEAVASAAHKNEDSLVEVGGRVRELEPRIDAQLGSLRADIKQALALAAASSRAEAESEALGRAKEAEKRLLARIHSVEEALEGRVSAVSTKVAASLGSELDKRFSGLYDQVEAQVSSVRADVEKLARDKMDTSALESYTSRVSSLFEQVASTLGSNIRDCSEASSAAVEVVRREVLALAAAKADKALEAVVARNVEGVRALGEQLAALASHVSDQLAAQPAALEEVKAEVRAVEGEVESASRSVSSLNSALSSTSAAIELQAHKLSALGHKLQHAISDVSALKESVYGAAGSGPAAALENAAVAVGGSAPAAQAPIGGGAPSVTSRLGSLERGLTELAAALGTKADEGSIREVERRLAALQRQADHASEGVRALTQSTYKRVDEHASAIQRLTLAINSHMEERPTVSAVKHLIEAAHLEGGDKLASSLLPVWDAVKALQGGLRDVGTDVKDVRTQLGTLQAGLGEVRTRVGAQQASITQAVLATVEDTVVGPLIKAQGTGLEARVSAMEGESRGLRAALDVVGQLQDKHGALVAALEDQITTQVASARAAAGALRNELGGRVEAAASALGGKVEALEVAVRASAQDTQLLRDQLSSRPVGEEVRQVAEAIARREVAKQAEREEGLRQALSEQLGAKLEARPTRPDVEAGLAAVAAAGRQAARDAQAAAEAACAQAEVRVMSAARAEADARVRGAEGRVHSLGARVEALEVAASGWAGQKEVLALGRVVEGKADRGEVEARVQKAEDTAVRALTSLRSDVEAELARKTDIKTFLAANSANAAAAAAAVGAAARAQPGSTLPPHLSSQLALLAGPGGQARLASPPHSPALIRPPSPPPSWHQAPAQPPAAPGHTHTTTTVGHTGSVLLQRLQQQQQQQPPAGQGSAAVSAVEAELAAAASLASGSAASLSHREWGHTGAPSREQQQQPLAGPGLGEGSVAAAAAIARLGEKLRQVSVTGGAGGAAGVAQRVGTHAGRHPQKPRGET